MCDLYNFGILSQNLINDVYGVVVGGDGVAVAVVFVSTSFCAYCYIHFTRSFSV
jgi:hypothetical protein